MFEIQTLNMTASVIWCLDHLHYGNHPGCGHGTCVHRGTIPNQSVLSWRRLMTPMGVHVVSAMILIFRARLSMFRSFKREFRRVMFFFTSTRWRKSTTLILGTSSQGFDRPVENQAMFHMCLPTCHKHIHLRCTREWFFLLFHGWLPLNLMITT